MAHLLSRLSNLSSRSHSLIHKSVRLFSSSSNSPCLTICVIDKTLPGGGILGDLLLFDAAKEELLIVSDKTLPKEIVNAELVGASHGWGFYCDRHHRSLSISDLFNPLASKSNPTMIPLPSLTPLYSCQTEKVWNVAMSSSPPDQEDQEDWVVGIKFLGNQLSLCRPLRDLRWTNISIPFESLQNSNLMYSKRDQTFNLPAPGGNYMCVWYLQFHKDDYPKFHELLFTISPPKHAVILNTQKVHQKRCRASLTGFHRFQTSFHGCCVWFIGVLWLKYVFVFVSLNQLGLLINPHIY